MHLQDRLPKARVVYCSATGVSEPRHLGYMSRLGLWGPGTSFPGGFKNFLNVVARTGVGAMEVRGAVCPAVRCCSVRWSTPTHAHTAIHDMMAIHSWWP